MPPPIFVVLAPYDLAWPLKAAMHAARLRILGPGLVSVHHIGSTAVPGLSAKPILDLMPLVRNLADLDQDQWRVEALGYRWHGDHGIVGRRYCTLDSEAGVRLVQLHFFQSNSPQVERHIAFRDYLRAHPAAARAYEAEKGRARDLHPGDPHAYTAEKAAWIAETEARALAWRAAQRPADGPYRTAN